MIPFVACRKKGSHAFGSLCFHAEHALRATAYAQGVGNNAPFPYGIVGVHLDNWLMRRKWEYSHDNPWKTRIYGLPTEKVNVTWLNRCWREYSCSGKIASKNLYM